MKFSPENVLIMLYVMAPYVRHPWECCFLRSKYSILNGEMKQALCKKRKGKIMFSFVALTAFFLNKWKSQVEQTTAENWLDNGSKN